MANTSGSSSETEGSIPSRGAMTFDEYQNESNKTAIYPDKGNNVTYSTLGLAGESGEVAEKIKKLIRDKNSIITEEFVIEIKKELGDVL